jgi:sarcosine oxidase subunit beta
MKPESADVVVIGAGIVGASVAWHLGARGCTDVLVLERADLPVSGSTARSAAGVRHQFASEVNIRLSLHSIERLRRFGEEVGGEAGLRQVGYLLLVDDGETWAAYGHSVTLQNRLGVRSRLLTPEEAGGIVPATRLDGLVGATFCPDDGYCDPHGVASGYLAGARARGVRLALGRPAIGLRRSGDRVVAVETPRGMVGCGTVVNACGPWAGQLGALAGLDIPVRPFRRCVYMTEPFGGIPGDIPLTIDTGSGFYLRKETGRVLFGLSNEAETSSESLAVDWVWLDTVMTAGLRRFPMLAEAALARRACWAGLYEITPDRLPVLGRHPDLPNYLDASGFSGHGIMHAPATGLLIAEEILDGRAHTIDIDPLRITRFAGGPRVVERHVF